MNGFSIKFWLALAGNTFQAETRNKLGSKQLKCLLEIENCILTLNILLFISVNISSTNTI